MRRLPGFILAVGGLVLLVYAIELRTWHGRGSWTGDPKGKILVATWLASELWVQPWLLAVGLLAMTGALILLLRGRRPHLER